VGFPLTAVVSLQVKPKSIADVLDQLSGHESARMISMVTGQAPVVFHGVFRDPQSLADFITEDIGSLPGIQTMDTSVALNVTRRYWMDRDGAFIGDQVEGLLRR
jgi:DNA-binding Lrp family transcriptional regulator